MKRTRNINISIFSRRNQLFLDLGRLNIPSQYNVKLGFFIALLFLMIYIYRKLKLCIWLHKIRTAKCQMQTKKRQGEIKHDDFLEESGGKDGSRRLGFEPATSGLKILLLESSLNLA